ncbi:uncharacterized protein LOC143372501 isoform X2 [Andrena cerasifolii]|uniref:uncharacterized protein LOC143372501 isoform X2 n=1 Tax=Andrena cerasifolii TaxID=2819439 RepID=UPI0040376B6C
MSQSFSVFNFTTSMSITFDSNVIIYYLVAEKTTHVNLGREIKVTLFKAHKWTAWLRLQIENEKNPLITSDPDYLCKDKWFTPLKIEGESFTEYKRRNNITNIMPDVPSTDGEESDDDMMDMSLW